MLKNKSRPFSLTVTAGLSLGALGILSLVFLPRMKTIAGFREQLRSKQDYIGQAEKLRPVIAALQTSRAEDLDYLQIWQHRCPERAELSALFGQLNHLAKQHDLTTTRFEPLASVSYGGLEKAPVNFCLHNCSLKSWTRS